jgi:uncharacterized protein (TIGR02246 family)
LINHTRGLLAEYGIVLPPDVKQKLDTLAAKVHDAYAKNDAAAYARAFTSDGILVTGTGKVLRGQEEIEQATKTTISSLGGIKDFQIQIDEAHALPDGTVWQIGHATIIGNEKSETILLWWMCQWAMGLPLRC